MKREIQFAEAYCHDCDETVGPDRAEDVGAEVAFEHTGHDVETDTWTEEEVVKCVRCGSKATRLDEVAHHGGRVEKIPFCNDCP